MMKIRIVKRIAMLTHGTLQNNSLCTPAPGIKAGFVDIFWQVIKGSTCFSKLSAFRDG